MYKLLLLAAVGFVIWVLVKPEPAVELGPGVRAPDTPRQVMLDDTRVVQHKGYRITKLAKFALQAKVLGREDYRADREADLSPTDLALGWGRMSDETVLAKIDISQSGRWYRWRTDNFPIPRREIETHSANMHIIPANDQVADELKHVRQGGIVALDGFLVRADADDGWRWQSSLTRNDTGARACEVVYVERLRNVH